MDNFYTRHALTRQMNVSNDGEVFVLSTARLNLTDGIDRPAVKEAVETLKAVERRSYMLCQAFIAPTELNGAPTVAAKRGFIVFKNRSVVTMDDEHQLPVRHP